MAALLHVCLHLARCVAYLLIVGIVLSEAFGKGIADDLQLCHLVRSEIERETAGSVKYGWDKCCHIVCICRVHRSGRHKSASFDHKTCALSDAPVLDCTYPLVLVGSDGRKRGLGENEPLVMVGRVGAAAVRLHVVGVRFGRQVNDVEAGLVAVHGVENDLEMQMVVKSSVFTRYEIVNGQHR